MLTISLARPARARSLMSSVSGRATDGDVLGRKASMRAHSAAQFSESGGARAVWSAVLELRIRYSLFGANQT